MTANSIPVRAKKVFDFLHQLPGETVAQIGLGSHAISIEHGEPELVNYDDHNVHIVVVGDIAGCTPGPYTLAREAMGTDYDEETAEEFGDEYYLSDPRAVRAVVTWLLQDLTLEHIEIMIEGRDMSVEAREHQYGDWE